MKCLNERCDAAEIENDDNFCYKCGQWTTKGYSFLKNTDNANAISHGSIIKQNGRIVILGSLLAILFILFFVILTVRGKDLFKPYYYLKKQVLNHHYGYNTTLLKTDNKYGGKTINTYNDAADIIKEDFSNQDVFCFNSDDVDIIADRLEEDYSIPSVSLCDMNTNEANKIKNVVDKLYLIFPNIKGALTNITITNVSKKENYIARFQPMYQFVNIKEDINYYNKVNKTQILLNSYYFLNEDKLKDSLVKTVGEDWYVKDATWESTIAHEFGHYISFVTLLRSRNIDNITLVTKENKTQIESIIEEFTSGSYSMGIVLDALNNYNNHYNKNMSLDEFAFSISRYAASKDKNGVLIADETIAEAIHDYFLHGNNMNQSSSEIINIIKSKL